MSEGTELGMVRIGVGIGMLKKADVRVLDPTVASLTCDKNQDAVNQLSSYFP